MKRNMKLIGLAACLISCTSLAVAQENPEPQERQQHEQRLPREVPNPEKIATQMTDQMQESLQLTEKQYKKIYKLNLKEQKEHFKAMQNSGEQRPPMGGLNERRPPADGWRRTSNDGRRRFPRRYGRTSYDEQRTGLCRCTKESCRNEREKDKKDSDHGTIRKVASSTSICPTKAFSQIDF